MDSSINTYVLFGGTSEERNVSTASAQHVVEYLPDAALLFWEKDDTIAIVDRDDLINFPNPFYSDFKPRNPKSLGKITEAFKKMHPSTKVFLALHGGRGEDGWIQKILEDAKIFFPGSGSAASKLCMDKPLSKKLINKNGVKVAKELLLSTNPDQRENELRSFFAENGEVVLKPTDDGSSRGLKFIRTDQDLTDALVELRNQTRAYLVETYISGRELTVGVLEKSDGSLIPLPCSEVELDPGRIFDYDAKYLGKGCREITPARITADEARRAQEVALIAHKTFGCKSYSRTDVILQPDSVFFLETNTLPGITKASFYPQQLAAAGIGFEQFLKTVLDLSK